MFWSTLTFAGVALSCARKSRVLTRDTIDFMVPLGTTIHLCGSVLTETFLAMVISLMLYGALPSFATMMIFILLFGIFAIGAPDVPGGTVMASMGIVVGILGFDPCRCHVAAGYLRAAEQLWYCL